MVHRPRPAAFEDAGVAAIIYTDIDRDGAMWWPERAGHRPILPAPTAIPVIASAASRRWPT